MTQVLVISYIILWKMNTDTPMAQVPVISYIILWKMNTNTPAARPLVIPYIVPWMNRLTDVQPLEGPQLTDQTHAEPPVNNQLLVNACMCMLS